MLLTLHKPHAKMESYKKTKQPRLVRVFNLVILMTYVVQACSQGPYVTFIGMAHVQTDRVRLQQTTTSDGVQQIHAWATKTHFLLVFFAFALFFLAWSARTVRRNQSPIILPLTGCCLTAHTKRMTLSEANDTTTSTYSPETWSLCSVLLYDLNHNCSASVGLSDSQFNIL